MRRFFLAVILIGNFLLQAQETFELSGVVLMDDKPVKGAMVTVLQTGDKQQTGEDGKFLFSLPEGHYTIRAGFDKRTGNVFVNLRKHTRIVILLSSMYEELSPVVFKLASNNPGTNPMTFSSIDRKKIEEKDNGKDIPYLLEAIPSVVTTSDAGNGVGYTSVRIRGISSQQINVTINGIPLNDPESQSVYWVDVPGLASSVQSISVVRGLGTSKFGTGAFGAQIELQTENFYSKPSVQFKATYGSFNTSSLSAKIASGLLDKHFNFIARFSTMHSDGYIDRATSDLKSYYLSSEYRNQKHRLTLIHFGGHEKTYQAWYGVDKQTFETNPTFNYAGAIYDNQWNIKGFYDNEVDNYTQNHYQLHYLYQPLHELKLGLTLHYTKGFGYYEQYKQNQDFEKYGLAPLIFGNDTVQQTDLIRRKWLDNDFYGVILHALIRGEKSDWLLGAGISHYTGNHFGRIIWARYASGSEIRHTYYENTGIKSERNFYIKNQTRLNPNLHLITDVQIRNVVYDAGYNPEKTFDAEEKFSMHDRSIFVNPKLGLSYRLHLLGNDDILYTFIGQTHREPNRTDYKESIEKPKPETLFDWELGYRGYIKHWSWKTNFYWMRYRDQLVYTGKIDDVGNPVRENVGKSYRAGWETEVRFHKFPWSMDAGLSLSINRNINYHAFDGTQWRNYGNTVIAFSPSLVSYWGIGFFVTEKLKVLAEMKYVGKQFMDNRNIEASVLPAYHVENLHLIWNMAGGNHIKGWRISGDVYNLLNLNYASNGYMWGDTPYYFPQARRHFGLSLSLHF